MEKQKKQLFKEVSIDKLKLIFKYNPCSGELYLNNAKVNYKLTSDNNYSVWYYCDKKQYKATAIEIAYAVHTGGYSKYKVRAKDLDNSNLKFSNLYSVGHAEDKTIQTALLNLRKYLKVVLANTDQNSVIVNIYNEGIINKKFDCPEAACNFIRRSKLRLLKDLERCGIDINSKLLY